MTPNSPVPRGSRIIAVVAIVDLRASVSVVSSTRIGRKTPGGFSYILNATVQLQPNEIERAKRAYNSPADCCNRLLYRSPRRTSRGGLPTWDLRQLAGGCRLRVVQRTPLLQVHPEPRGRAKVLRQSQGRLRRDAPPFIHELVYALIRHANRFRELALSHLHRDEKLLAEDLSGVNWRAMCGDANHRWRLGQW